MGTERTARTGRGLDWRLFVALRTRCHSRFIELPVIIFSSTGNWGFFWVILAAALWLAGAADDRMLFQFTVILIYATLVFNYGIKVVLKRERPTFDDPRLAPLVGTPSSKSFPSSHSAMSFAAACAFTWYHPRFWPLFFGLALAMSWSRVYVGVHFPSDVVAGMAVGLAAGAVGVVLAGML